MRLFIVPFAVLAGTELIIRTLAPEAGTFGTLVRYGAALIVAFIAFIMPAPDLLARPNTKVSAQPTLPFSQSTATRAVAGFRPVYGFTALVCLCFVAVVSAVQLCLAFPRLEQFAWLAGAVAAVISMVAIGAGVVRIRANTARLYEEIPPDPAEFARMQALAWFRPGDVYSNPDDPMSFFSPNAPRRLESNLAAPAGRLITVKTLVGALVLVAGIVVGVLVAV